MADVIVRGMEMPEFCDECGCKRRTQRGACCGILGKPLKTSRNYKRDDDCPLVPLPEGYGRLIDADAFCKQIANDRRIGGIVAAGMISYIEHAPTIVPAEGGGEGGARTSSD